MSRRNTYLLGGLAVLLGAAMLVLAIIGLASNGDDDSTVRTGRTSPERPITPGSPPPPGEPGSASEPSGAEAAGEEIRRRLARRRLVRAPDFSAEVIHEGTIPRPLREPFSSATEGGRLSLEKLRGTPVVVYFWSSRCAPCRGDARLVEATWKRWGPRGVLFVSASVQEPAATARAVVRQYDLTFPAVSDQQGENARRYGVTAVPHTVFISGAGDIVGEVLGSPSVRQLELGAQAAESAEAFGSEQGSSRVPLG